MIRLRAFFAICGLLVVAGCCQNQGPPFSPDDALSTFELPEGFRLELVASEPLINDPVDMAFDADGNLYVVEMPDYPTDDVKGPFSRIRKVVDSDGDGQYDSSTVFTEEMPFENGAGVVLAVPVTVRLQHRFHRGDALCQRSDALGQWHS